MKQHTPTWKMFLHFSVMMMTLLVGLQTTNAEDWPTYRKNYFRSATTSEALDASRLTQAWVWKSVSPPRPAWPGPAKWDAYAGIKGLRSMRNYDPVFHPIAVGNHIYFGNSVDDSLYCLDAKTGKVKWTFNTGGPIRITPTFDNDKIYFGSDDGYAYCLDAKSGQQIWRFSPTVGKRLVINNGRLISFYPVRTGVIIQNDTAYFGASFLPWKESYLCAVDATTGQFNKNKTGQFIKQMNNQTMEGAMLMSDEHLISPQGRVAPLLFDKVTGKPWGSLRGGGGVFALLTDDQHILHGPGNKKGWLVISKEGVRPKKKEKVASFDKGNAMVVSGNWAFILTDRYIAALDRIEKLPIWQTAGEFPYDIILSGETLYVGGHDEVAALHAKTGKWLWKAPVHGNVHGLVVANGQLLASTDEGYLYSFVPTGKAVVIKQTEDDAVQGPPSPKVRQIRGSGLVGRWAFHRSAMSKAGSPSIKTMTVNNVQVKNLTGGLAAPITGQAKVHRFGNVEAIELTDSAPTIIMTDDLAKARLPKKFITVQAWVRVDKTQKWGSIIGAIQDNGDYERGWLLGYSDDRFVFAIAATGKAKPKLTYLKSNSPFIPKSWNHVAGTYDGKTMRLYVNGKFAAQSTDQKGDISYQPKTFYQIGAYHDDDEYFRMKGMIHEVRVYSRVLREREIRADYVSKRSNFPKPPAPVIPVDKYRLAFGPILQFTSHDTASVYWETKTSCPSVLSWGLDDQRHEAKDSRPKKQHRLTITGLRKDRVYQYQITAFANGRKHTTDSFECDTFLNFDALKRPMGKNPFGDDDAVKQKARQILAVTKVGPGIGLMIGGDGQLACELAKQSKLRITIVETDLSKVEQLRKTLVDSGVYGRRVAVLHVKNYNAMPIPIRFATLIVSSTPVPLISFDIASELLRPNGGVLLVGQTNCNDTTAIKKQLNQYIGDSPTNHAWIENNKTIWAKVVRKPLSFAGAWSHMYGDANNSAYGGETLDGASRTDQLEVQWVGRPGPRYQIDRQNRKSSPLAINGRLFMQGQQRIITVDAYNGTILWSLEIPEMARFNVTRDSGNWCADDNHVFLVAHNLCMQINAATGKLTTLKVTPAGDKRWNYDWGYIARHENMIIGSANKQDSAFTDWWGGDNWYDQKEGAKAAKVCSDNLFGREVSTGAKRWEYRKGLILNPTITLANDMVVFVENRHPKIKAANTRRIQMPELWQQMYLVAINWQTGRTLWEKPIAPRTGTTAFYLASGDKTLVLTSSSAGGFSVYAYTLTNGKKKWDRSIKWEADHHGKHLSHPAIRDGLVYLRPKVLDLKTGKDTNTPYPGGHTCSSYVLTKNATIMRAGSISMWDKNNNQVTRWNRLRPDCWISTIPACGMILSPEGGGGCSCGSWMETSLGFMPILKQKK